MTIDGNVLVVDNERYEFSYPIYKVGIYLDYIAIMIHDLHQRDGTRLPVNNVYLYSKCYTPTLRCISDVLPDKQFAYDMNVVFDKVVVYSPDKIEYLIELKSLKILHQLNTE